jgi:hypothetical protein
MFKFSSGGPPSQCHTQEEEEEEEELQMYLFGYINIVFSLL